MNIKPTGIYIFSTDTVYGLGTSLSNEAGIEKLFKIKGRSFKNPMAVLVANLEQADALVEWPTPLYRDPLKQLWPGGLTAVVPSQKHVSLRVRAGFQTLGVRCPKHPELLKLLLEHGPFVATSANRAGLEPLSDEVQIRAEFQNEVDDFLFFDPKPNGLASTVVDLTVVPPKILRQGPESIALFEEFVV